MASIQQRISADRFMLNMIERGTHVNTVRVGDFKWSIQQSDFNGWLKCDGRLLSGASFPQLFQLFQSNGLSFPPPDPSAPPAPEGSFYLPDCRGRVPGGIGEGYALTERTYGDFSNDETHTLSVDELPSHTHDVTLEDAGTHTHTSNADGGQYGLAFSNNSSNRINADNSAGTEINLDDNAALTINSAGNHNHDVSVGSTGEGQSFSVMQPTLFIGNLFIYSGTDRDYEAYHESDTVHKY